MTSAKTIFGLSLLVVFAGVGFGDEPITIFLAGDSTMAEKRPDRRPETGWGEALQHYFDQDEVLIENHARNGRSTRTFIEEGRWDVLLSDVEQGDYVFIQFGHNDQSKEKVDRYTPPDAYQANLRRFVEDVRAKQATPVLFTPVVRRRFDEVGHFYDVHGAYPDLVREIAAETGSTLIDMHHLSERVLIEYGPERSKELFLWLEPQEHENYPGGLTDDTHFSPRGADKMARLAAEALRSTEHSLAPLIRLTDRSR